MAQLWRGGGLYLGIADVRSDLTDIDMPATSASSRAGQHCRGTRPPRVYTHVHTYVYGHVYTHVYAHVYAHVSAQVCTHVSAQVYARVSAQVIHMSIDMSMDVHTRVVAHV